MVHTVVNFSKYVFAFVFATHVIEEDVSDSQLRTIIHATLALYSLVLLRLNYVEV